jgi:hypothetical protein
VGGIAAGITVFVSIEMEKLRMSSTDMVKAIHYVNACCSV